MKIALVFFLAFESFAFSAMCNPTVANPIADYAAFLELSGRTAYKWNVDINHDGHIDVLLGLKPNAANSGLLGDDYDEATMRSFTAYISTGNQYVSGCYVQSGVGQIGEIITVKVDECYVGNISEVSSYGIVSIERTSKPSPESGGDVKIAIIYAYTLDGDTVTRTKLAEFDPDESNLIYSKYLTPSKRTPVNIQEVPL